MLRVENLMGESFGLCCPRHTEKEIRVYQAEDFTNLSPEGGCLLRCDRRLDVCGHRCLAKCHSESMHQVFPCPQPCKRLHDVCNHGCPKSCSENCGNCMVKIDGVQLLCGHVKDNVYCHLALDLKMIKCTVLVQKQVPLCKHDLKLECYKDPSKRPCPVSCTSTLQCGHLCKGTCGRCYETDPLGHETVSHAECSVICGRKFGTCNHACPRKCHDGSDCGLCLSPCEVSK